MGKHAWMIMAHNQFDLLKKLLKTLDNEDADIFLHVDKKAAFDISILSSSLIKSQYYMTDRIKITWGGYSIGANLSKKYEKHKLINKTLSKQKNF
ncbi:MAG: hypothetical protein K1W19_13720, partial [Lachnospiraceae bacterium]